MGARRPPASGASCSLIRRLPGDEKRGGTFSSRLFSAPLPSLALSSGPLPSPLPLPYSSALLAAAARLLLHCYCTLRFLQGGPLSPPAAPPPSFTAPAPPPPVAFAPAAASSAPAPSAAPFSFELPIAKDNVQVTEDRTLAPCTLLLLSIPLASEVHPAGTIG